MKRQKNSAVLLIDCEYQTGLVAAVTDFLLKSDGYILSLDEHVDVENNHFFMRVEWKLEGFTIPENEIGGYFENLVASRYNIHWKLHIWKHKHRVAIFVSKYAHCFFDILSRWEGKEWDIDIPVIISNHEKFRPIAERHHIPYHYLPITKENKKEQEAKTLAILKDHDIDLIVLARYMQILSEDFIDAYVHKIINIHHSSLPAFPGSNPYRSAYERGVKIIGATSHYVTKDLDAGPIIVQDVIPVSHNDSIAEMKRKGKDIEKLVLARAVWEHINHKVICYENRTVILN